jgi:hypothetical protein
VHHKYGVFYNPELWLQRQYCPTMNRLRDQKAEINRRFSQGFNGTAMSLRCPTHRFAHASVVRVDVTLRKISFRRNSAHPAKPCSFGLKVRGTRMARFSYP